MTTRDARGRFTNADHAAAERVLEAAVREAMRLIRDGAYSERITSNNGRVLRDVRGTLPQNVNAARATMLTAATAADLLLSERAS